MSAYMCVYIYIGIYINTAVREAARMTDRSPAEVRGVSRCKRVCLSSSNMHILYAHTHARTHAHTHRPATDAARPGYCTLNF